MTSSFLRPASRLFVTVAVAGSLLGCSVSDLVTTDLPPTTADPESFKTPDGAINVYRGLITQFRTVTSGSGSAPSFIVASGLLGDELISGQYRQSAADVSDTPQSLIDSRATTSGQSVFVVQPLWNGLHGIRQRASTAIESLRHYAPESPKDRIGHAFALWGMAENMLADLFCSGIPLTTVEFEGGFSYAAASSRDEVYTHALAMFDSALVYSVDSTDYRDLARVGRGWALLQLNRYAEAAAAVHDVPTSFAYKNLHAVTADLSQPTGVPNFTWTSSGFVLMGPGSVADHEGGNGLPYLTSGDVRTKSTPAFSYYYPSTVAYLADRWAKPTLGTTPIIMASGVEARLIEAEAALQANDPSWLTILNALRTTCTSAASCATPAPAGTGGFAGLAPLTDPGTPAARVDTLFKERAFWLFLTGRRLGDMRRLVRQYGRLAESVFPIGTFPTGSVYVYGNGVNLPPPASEMRVNTNYAGCIDRGA